MNKDDVHKGYVKDEGAGHPPKVVDQGCVKDVKDEGASHPLSPPRVCEAVEGSSVKVRERL